MPADAVQQLACGKSCAPRHHCSHLLTMCHSAQKQAADCMSVTALAHVSILQNLHPEERLLCADIPSVLLLAGCSRLQ